MNTRDYLDQETQLAEEARALNDLTIKESRDFTEDEQKQWDGIQSKLKAVKRAATLPVVEPQKPSVPAVLKNERGDDFNKSMAAYLRYGDASGLGGLMTRENGNDVVEIRASNATDMNIGTAADGGDTVASPFYNQVIAKRSEMSLAERLGVRRIPGTGTTVYVPYDNEADGEFITKSEATAFDLDSPALAKATMTLVKYTKQIQISDELMQDTAVNLMNFLSDWIARGMAKTMNSLLIAQVGTAGTAFKTTAANNAFAIGEFEATALNDTVGPYLDDAGSVAWVMRPSVYATLASTVSTSARLYGSADANSGSIQGRELLGYPVHFSNKAAAIATTAKVAYFGNWNYVGWREGPGFTILRDPYSAASTGQLNLWLYFRTVFTVLQADAIGYLKMKT